MNMHVAAHCAFDHVSMTVVNAKPHLRRGHETSHSAHAKTMAHAKLAPLFSVPHDTTIIS
jgi:hypothetical protein